ncbi:MAG TPA: exodeoxyribonuclease VII small subunit [Lachnospiraceae bacterium]|nr:exodeoxyribonuclease VII small subunit [Lachnospiraceae bacterium]
MSNNSKKDEVLDELSIEEAFKKLEQTVKELECEDITLEASFQAYKAGMETLQYCNQMIDRVEKKVMILNKDGELDEF